MAVNWASGSDPNNSTDRLSVLQQLRDRDESILKMDYSSDTNIITGTVRLDTSGKRIETYNGSTWSDALTDYTNHLTNTSNPHTVTAAQVGTSTAQWNADKLQGVDVTVSSVADKEVLAYDSTSGDWINQTAAEAGLATSSGLSSHTSNTSNPHSVTAAQTSAFAIASNLSEGTPATMRTNLGLGSLATLSTVSNGEWSGTDLAVVNGGTGSSTASGARSNLGAAASGSNSDITALTAATSITTAGHLTFGTSSAHHILFRTNGGNVLELDDSNNFFPVSAGGINLGTASKWWNGVTTTAIECPSGAGSDLLVKCGSANDIDFWTNGSSKFLFEHSTSTLRPAGAAGANLGDATNYWNGLHVAAVNFVVTAGGAPGAVVGTIPILVNGVSRNLAYY